MLEELKTAKNTALDLGNTDIAKQVEQAEIFVRNIVRAQAVSPDNIKVPANNCFCSDTIS